MAGSEAKSSAAIGAMSNLSFRESLSSCELQLCFDFWRVRRRGREVPLKCSIDPLEIPHQILPNLFLYECVESRFRCRLAGTRIVEAYHRDPTGSFLDEAMGLSAANSRTRLYAATIRTGMPVVYWGKLSDSPNDWMDFKRLLLPISKEGKEIDMVFGMVIFPRLIASRIPPDPLRGLPIASEVWATEASLEG